MRKKLSKIFMVKILALGVAVHCVLSLSATIATELRVNDNKTMRSITPRVIDLNRKNPQIAISGEDLLYIKEHALRAVENASNQLTELGLSEVDFARHEKFLPKNLMTRLYAVLEVSNMNSNPEERVKTLMHIQGYNCQDYLITWFTIEVVEIILKTSCNILPDPTCELALEVLRLADTVFFWATVLCYLGIV